MALFEEFNLFHHPAGTVKRGVSTSWILHWTEEHDYGVAVFWDQDSNEMACFSLVWPHSGWQEYGHLNFSNDHSPWGAPGDRWSFIGVL